MRVAGCLNATTGAVHARRAEETGRSVLIDLYREVADCYSEAQVIYMVQDNWPVHYHPDIIGKLEPQTWPWPFKVPGNWPEIPEEPTTEDPLPIQVVGLPTYAPWAGPDREALALPKAGGATPTSTGGRLFLASRPCRCFSRSVCRRI